MNNVDKTMLENPKAVGKLAVVAIIIMVIAFQFSSMRKGQDGYVTFTRDDLERIAQLQAIEDESGSGANIIAYKDSDGNLMIGWTQSRTRR